MRINDDEEAATLKIGQFARYIISTSGRSSSIRRYNFLLQDLLKLNFAYIPFSQISNDDPIRPEAFLNAIKSLKAIGGAISKDIKAKVVPYLDSIDPFAKQVGSVNTVVWEHGGLCGHNTDMHGFRVAIENGINSSGIIPRNALIYGYGGVCNVVCAVLKSLGMVVSITGRNKESAAKRSIELGLIPWDNRPRDLFVNAAPVTNDPLNKAPGFLDGLNGSKIVFDHEMPGSFLFDYCKENGIFHISGSDMYYPQMYRQWELFLRGIVLPDTIPGLIADAEAGNLS